MSEQPSEANIICKHCSRPITFYAGHWRHEGGLMLCRWGANETAPRGTYSAEPREEVKP